MSFFRSYLAPLLIVLIFAVAMLAVSARIFLPSDMMAPAPMEDTVSAVSSPPLASRDGLAPDLSDLIHGPAAYQVEG
ncbi:MAG: hypothetical protein VKI82_05010 [Leptolyngbya sp.]|nr:hypothetical protein [Leptolyngbya sp.]